MRCKVRHSPDKVGGGTGSSEWAPKNRNPMDNFRRLTICMGPNNRNRKEESKKNDMPVPADKNHPPPQQKAAGKDV